MKVHCQTICLCTHMVITIFVFRQFGTDTLYKVPPKYRDNINTSLTDETIDNGCLLFEF